MMRHSGSKVLGIILAGLVGVLACATGLQAQGKEVVIGSCIR